MKKRKRRFTIGNKILTGFSMLIVAFVIYVVYSVLTINSNNILTRESTEVISPSADILKEFKTLVIRSRMLVTNWVYLPTNSQDKDELRGLNKEYLQIKADLEEKMAFWEDTLQAESMNGIFESFENLMDIQRDEIMSKLTSFDTYEDAQIKFWAEHVLENEIIPKTMDIIASMDTIITDKDNAATIAQKEVLEASNRLKKTTIILGLILSVLGILVSIFMARSITRPVIFLRSIINKLANGELPDNRHKRFASDEIGEMAEAVDTLVNGLRSTSLFAENIGKGKYDSDYAPLSESDVLGNSLIEMRNNLMKVAEEDKRRGWATEGMAKFGEILRKNNDDIQKLSDEIISNLVKYMKANQGGLYIISDENEDQEKHMYLASCYAWNRKKYLEQKILMGEGLIGQSWIEKDTIYLTDIPEDYISITSGLGEANPRSILISPLKVNDEVYGAIEIASFNEFEPFEIEFVEKVAESIASTISSVRINQTTQRLLEESTEMTEQMRAQEEEMRQNMEELQATQEEMQRTNYEKEAREKIVDSTNMIFEIDSESRIIQSNMKALEILNFKSSELIGMSLAQIMLSMGEFNQMTEALQNSETWSGIFKFKTKNKNSVAAKVSAGKIVDPASHAIKRLIFAAEVPEIII